MVGGEAALEEQEDGTSALILPERSYLKTTLRCHQLALFDDGRIHEFTVLVAMRLDRLPTSAMPILSGGPAPSEGDKVENVLEKRPVMELAVVVGTLGGLA